MIELPASGDHVTQSGMATSPPLRCKFRPSANLSKCKPRPVLQRAGLQQVEFQMSQTDEEETG